MGGRMTTERIPQGLRSRPRHEVVILVNGTGSRRAEMPRDRPVELAGGAEGSARAALCAPRMLGAGHGGGDQPGTRGLAGAQRRHPAGGMMRHATATPAGTPWSHRP
jgi:hypothetical protein